MRQPLAAGPKAYIGNFKDSTVSVIDTATGAVIGTVPIPAGPHGMRASPDQAGSYDYICAVHPYMSGKIIVRAP